jgi:hypothetical protein|tara:strand:- start:74 stop:622 length:549 start_codon:yes stop_codon:yes gene_type:complete
MAQTKVTPIFDTTVDQFFIGKKITLIEITFPQTVLGATITAGAFDIGETYTILTAGTTDFTTLGAADSVAGTVFVATGAGTGGAGVGTATVAAKTGPNSVLAKVHELIQGNGFNIIGFGAMTNTATVQPLMIEGDYGTDKYDGTNSETLAAHIEDLIIGLGNDVDEVDCTAVTVAAKTFALA